MGERTTAAVAHAAPRRGGAYEHVRALIDDRRCVILDGATGTELPLVTDAERGLDERLWGTRALMESVAAVAAVHRRYVEAGCDVISTNTWGLPTALTDEFAQTRAAQPVHWIDVARRGLRVARESVAEGGRSEECAVAFSINGDVDRPEGAETIRLLSRAFASEPPDLILLETLSMVRPSLDATVEALLATGIPVWLSFRRCRHGLCGVYGQHWGGPEGDAFGRAARRFEEMGVGALSVNCIPPDHVDGMVSYLRDFTDLPLGVYPNLGYHTSDGWRFDPGVGGGEYAQMALRWRDEGAQIVGGCCGVGPGHIRAAREALAGTVPGTRRAEEPLPGGAAHRAPRSWVDRRRRTLAPLPFPQLVVDEGIAAPTATSFLAWRHLFDERLGAHQRCLDVGCGSGLLTVQLALNGALHVHAIDADERAVDVTQTNAFRNGVSDRVTAAALDVYPWVPEERYEVIVADLDLMPLDPQQQAPGHMPTDYRGRSLLDHFIAKLPEALAPEGVAYVVHPSVLSQDRTIETLERHGLEASIVDYSLLGLPSEGRSGAPGFVRRHEGEDVQHLELGDEIVIVGYLLEIRCVDATAPASRSA